MMNTFWQECDERIWGKNNTNTTLSAGTHVETIKAQNSRLAGEQLEQFIRKMTAKYPNFKVITTSPVQVFNGMVIYVTYEV